MSECLRNVKRRTSIELGRQIGIPCRAPCANTTGNKDRKGGEKTDGQGVALWGDGASAEAPSAGKSHLGQLEPASFVEKTSGTF